MSIIDIDSALITAYIGLGLGLPTAYEGEDAAPPATANAGWAQVFIVPAPTETNSLGVNGTDLHTGFMQIDFYIKHGKGRAALIDYYNTVRATFIGGKSFSANSQYVTIITVDRSSVIEEDGWMKLSVTVNWQAETIRPTIT